MSTEPKPVRTRMKAPERREAILGAAARTFARLGYRVATMGDIAAEAGITQPMLYRHFPSKRDLYLAVIDKVYATVNEVFAKASSLTEMGQAAVALALSQPDSIRLRLQALAECEDTEIRTRFQQLLAVQIRMIEAMIVRDQAAGRILAGPSPTAVAGLFAALGIFLDVSVAVDLAGPGSGVAEAGALFWQLVSPAQIKPPEVR